MMSDAFHKPVMRPSSMFDVAFGSVDPAERSRVAYATASALLNRVRAEADPETVDKLVEFTAVHGIETIAELWAGAGPRSLPGALWRVYLLRLSIRTDPYAASLMFGRGTEACQELPPGVPMSQSPTATTVSSTEVASPGHVN